MEIWTAGRGDTVGEIALLDGEGHTMSVRVTETATVLALGRLEFAALLARQDPSAFRLKRRLASLFTARLRNQLRHLAVSLGGELAGPPAEDAARTFAELEPCGPPDSKYVRRMATFHDFDALALWGFLTSGTLRPVPAGAHACSPKGRRRRPATSRSTARSRRCCSAATGASASGWRGRARTFGYESLIDGRPSPVTAITRERALLLVLPRDPFEQLFNGEDAVSRVFLDVIQRELVATLRQTLRQHARLAVSV